MKRIIALLLVFLMTFTALVSCKPAGKKEKKPEKQVLENVYTAQELNVPENVTSMQTVKSGDKIYVNANREYQTVDEDGNEIYNWDNPLYVTDEDFTSYTEIRVFKSDSTWNEEQTEASGSSLNGIYPTLNGDILILYNEWYENWSDPDNYVYKQNYTIERVNSNGDTVMTAKLDFSVFDLDYVYISSISEMIDGQYILVCDSRVFIMDSQGKIVKSSEPSENIEKAMTLSDGRVVAFYYDDNWNYAYGFYDVESGDVETVTTFTEMNNTPIVTDDGRLFMKNSTELVEYNLETGEEIGPEINWLNSDINPNYVWQINYIGGAFVNFDSSDWENPKMYKYTPCGDVVEKYVITLATLYDSYDLYNNVIEFNRSNGEYRIIVKSYYEYDDEGNNIGAEKLDNDIVQGNIPDIISLADLDFKKYVSKGILADIGALIDADPDMSRDDFLENVLQFGMENGTLYSLIASFSISSVIGKTSVVGDRLAWTWKDLNDTLARYPGSVAFTQMERENLLREILRTSLYDFVDYSTGSVKFDSEEFAEILKFCSTYPETINWDEFYEDYDWELELQDYRDNKTLLQTAYFSSFWDASYTLNDNPFEDEVTIIGYPTSNGVSGSVILPESEWAISSKSLFKEQAFDFLKMISVEKADEIYSFPANRAAFDKLLEDAKSINENGEEDPLVKPMPMPMLKNVVVDDAAAEEVVEDVIVDEDIIVEDSLIAPEEPVIYGGDNGLTPEQADSFAEFVRSVSRRQAPYEHPLIDIIIEESASYFDGVKSVEETCKIIQSRAFLYVSENM